MAGIQYGILLIKMICPEYWYRHRYECGTAPSEICGASVTSDIHNASGGNASAARFDNIDITECKGHGMYFQGGDANQCGVYHVDVRDCGGAGFYDNSFLGNQFFSCMTHSNKGGSYKAIDGNNRTGFYGCYAENDQPPVYLAGAACWFGGLPSQGVIIASPWAKVYSYSTVDILRDGN
jgi:hypothetical protein